MLVDDYSIRSDSFKIIYIFVQDKFSGMYMYSSLFSVSIEIRRFFCRGLNLGYLVYKFIKFRILLIELKG